MRHTALALAAAVGGLACGGGDTGAPDGGADAGPVDPTEAIFDPDRLLDIEIELAPADWEALRYQHRDFYDLMIDSCPRPLGPRPYTYFDGTVTIDGEVVAQVGVRKKGFLGSVTPARPSLKLSFDEYVDGRRYSGLRRMTLNNNLQDPSLMSTCLSLAVFRAAGVPASRCNHARVTVNGNYLGIYSHVESIKQPFRERNFPTGDGNLYEGTLADFRPDWVAMYETKPGNNGDRSDLQQMVTALEASDAELLDQLEPILDVDAFLTYWAAELLVGHWDGYNGNRNNHYIFRDVSTGTFQFIPWSPDAGFGRPHPFLAYDAPASVFANSLLSQRLYALPAVRDQYQARLQQLLDTVWNEAELLAEIDRMEALLRPHIHVSEAAFDMRVTDTRDYVRRIRAEIEASLAQDPDWTHPLPDGHCLAEVGPITGTFTAQWGSFPPANPFLNATGTLDVQLAGQPAETFPSAGAAVGPDGDPSNPKTNVAVFGLRGDGSLLFPVLQVDPDLFDANTTLPVDLYDVFGVLLNQEAGAPQGDFDMLGFTRGTLTIDEADMTDGGTVSGSFSLQLVGGGAL